MSVLDALTKFKLEAFTITLGENEEAITLACQPVNYMHNLKDVQGKIDMGAFSKFTGSGDASESGANVMQFLADNGDKGFEMLEASQRLQEDMYLVKGITNINLVYELSEANDEMLVSEFKAIVRTKYGEDEYQRLLNFILKLSGVAAKKN